MIGLISLLGLYLAAPSSVEAQAGTPWEVLAEINGYRAANGLAPLVENQSLNIAAQNHVNWMAETGDFGHTGADGSTYTDRALAAGYGDGLSVRVTENWARGHGLTASGAVYDMWAPSAIHNSQMLTNFYKEYGAGVAVDQDGMTVYVVNFGIVVGGSISYEQAQPITTSTGPTITPEAFIQPIITATPHPDGSVIHIVQFGQTLWTIAEAYALPLEDLLAQNYLTEDSEIFPNQELLIMPVSVEVKQTVSVTPTPEVEATATPNPTRTPTRVPSQTPTEVKATPTEQPRSIAFWNSIFQTNGLWLGIGLVIVSLVGIGLVFLTSSRLR